MALERVSPARVWSWLVPDGLSAGSTKALLKAAFEAQVVSALVGDRRRRSSWGKANLIRGLG